MRSRDGIATHNLTKNGYWHVRFFCEDGEVRNKNCKTKTERDALLKAVKRRDDLDYWFPEVVVSSARKDVGTFQYLAEKWLEHSEKVREISQSCLNNYKCHLNHHVLPVLGDRFLRDLDLRSIEEVAAVIKQKKPQTRSYQAVRRSRMNEEVFEDDEFLSTAYRREILTVGCMVTKFGLDRGYLSVNPFREFKLPECPEQPYDYWRLNEEDAFLSWLEGGGVFYKEVGKPHSLKSGKKEKFLKRFKTRGVEDLHDVVLFALRSGLRKGEIGALTPRDVNFPKNCVVIRRAYSDKEKRVKKTTKGKTFRIIEMNDDMRNILERRMARMKSDTEYIFNTRTWAIKNFSKYCVKAQVREIHFHSLRHTCLTNLANGYGMDTPLPLPQVQKIAGHQEISTTMRYVHTDGIENTGARQWSREKRKALQAHKPASETVKIAHLRVINSQ